MARRLLLVLPALAALVVAWALLVTGRPRAVLAVQVHGGPSAGLPESLALTALRSDGERSTLVPDLPLRVVARAGAAHATWKGVSGSTGHVEVALDWSGARTAEPELVVVDEASGEVLAAGSLALDVESWARSARRQGGIIDGSTGGSLALRVGPEEGALAVPFESHLVVQLSSPPGSTRERVTLTVELVGAELSARPESVELDAAGAAIARLALVPLSHAVSLKLEASTPSGVRGQWYGALPVVPGALHLRLEGERAIVRSPIERSYAFVSLVTSTRRVAGAIVPLAADEHGGSAGELALSAAWLELARREPVWAVVSSEFDKRSPGVVGWPLLAKGRASLPGVTFDVADHLLLDGSTEALAHEQERRLSQRRWAALLLVLLAFAMTLLLWREAQRRPAPLATGGLAEPEREVLRGARAGWALWVALAIVAFGVGALAYFGLAPR